MKLALKMIRDARNLDFKGALQNEINVALNKIQDSEFDLGISEVLLKPRGVTSSPHNPGFASSVSNDQVQSYFQPNKWAQELQLELVERALLPTRFYYEKFSDQVRLWVNEDSTTQPEVREYFEQELKEALREQGIDIRDRALTIESAREQIYKQELVQRRQQAFDERLTNLLKDNKLRESYFQRTNDVLQRLEQGASSEFYALVNAKIQSIFEHAYLEKLQVVFDRS